MQHVQVELGNTNQKKKLATFDDAIAAAGVGKYNILLFLAITPAIWSVCFDTSNTSIILPSAECDLGLTPLNKGILNAASYAGMLCSAIVWGFLADVLGRRKILVYGFFADGICNVLSGFSPNFPTLLFFKILSGMITSGPFASVMAYCAEFHSTHARPRIMLIMGTISFTGFIVNTGLAWLVVPTGWSFVIGDGDFVYNSWRIYLSLCGVPILFGAAALSFFPESPKFLMNHGRNDEALEVFQYMYKVNTGKSVDTFRIQSLEDEVISTKTSAITHQKSVIESLREGFRQIKPLFMGKYGRRLCLVVLIQFCIMMSANTIRLWQPQLFTTLRQNSNGADTSAEQQSFCDILDNSTLMKAAALPATNVTEIEMCIPKPMHDSSYLSSVIVSATMVCCVFLAGVFVNLLGNKNLLRCSFTVAIGSLIFLNWASHPSLILTLTCLAVGLMITSTSVAIGITVTLFPTSLRTLAITVGMTVGYIGSLSGNVMFPLLLSCSCLTAILTVACVIICGGVLTIFLPTPEEDLK